jgi:hypothetical protein
MQVIKLRIDGQVYFLPAETDLLALRAEIVTAVRSGADFVEFETHGHGQVAVLMTPHLPVRFEAVERSAETVEAWEVEPPSFDLDQDLYYG